MSDSTTDTSTTQISTAQTTDAPPGPATPPLTTGTRRPRGPRSWLAGSYVGEMLAEFFGTFVLIAFGCGSVAVAVVGLPGSGRQDVAFGAANWLIIAWGWGLGVVFGVYVCSGISGGHIDPAVTLAFSLRRRFPWRKLPGYWLAQVLGAFAAAAVVYAVYDAAINAFNQTNHIADRAQSLPTFSIFATFPAPLGGPEPHRRPVPAPAVPDAAVLGLLPAGHRGPLQAPGAGAHRPATRRAVRRDGRHPAGRPGPGRLLRRAGPAPLRDHAVRCGVRGLAAT